MAQGVWVYTFLYPGFSGDVLNYILYCFGCQMAPFPWPGFEQEWVFIFWIHESPDFTAQRIREWDYPVPLSLALPYVEGLVNEVDVRCLDFYRF